MSKVLITGATGFIGNHVTRLCLERGDDVRVMVMPGDLRYVSRPEFAAFAGDETPAEREALFRGWLAEQPPQPEGAEEQARAVFEDNALRVFPRLELP